MENLNTELLENRVLEELYDCISDEFGGGYLVDNGREYSGFFSPLGPDIAVLQIASQIPDELENSDNLENFFPNSTFEIPRVGIEMKYYESKKISNDLLENIPRGTTNSDEEYPEIVLLIHEENIDQKTILEYEDNPHVVIADIFDRAEIRSKLAPTVISRLSAMEDTFDGEFADNDPYINSFRSKVRHFNEVLRGYNAGQKGAIVVLLQAFFESYCYQLLEEYAKKEAPNSSAGNFVTEDDRFEVKLKACRLLELIEEDEFTPINKIRTVRNPYAHDILAYDDTEGPEIDQSEIEDAIRIYEKYIGVKMSMVDG